MLRKIIANLNEEDKVNVAVMAHIEPDYDALSSTLTVSNYLNRYCPNCKIYPILEKDSLDKVDLKNNLKIYKKEDVSDINFDYCIVCDVNEESRLYGLEILRDVPKENRYLFDHHSGNRKELDICKENAIEEVDASSTAEVLYKDILEDCLKLDSDSSYNIYIGIISDTSAFTRGVNDITRNIINWNLLGLSQELRNFILSKFTSLSPKEQQFLDEITLDEENSNDFISFFRLDDDNLENISSYMNSKVEDKISANPNGISVFIITCKNKKYLKFRKGIDSDYDIVELAMKLGGGGHENRSATVICDTDYQEVVEQVKDASLVKVKKLNSNGSKA